MHTVYISYTYTHIILWIFDHYYTPGTYYSVVSTTTHLVLQNNVPCFIQVMIMEVHFRTENQKISEVKITYKSLPRKRA